MSNSMLAAVHDAANGSREPDNRDDAAGSAANNSIIAGLAAALAWAMGRPRADAPPPAPAPAPAAAPVPAVAPAPSEAAAAAAAIATMCNEAGVSTMAAALITEGVTAETARTRIASAGEIRTAVTLAAKASSAIDPKLADGYIAAGASIEHVRADLFGRITAAQSPEINANHQATTDKVEAKASTAFWADVTAKVNAEIAPKK